MASPTDYRPDTRRVALFNGALRTHGNVERPQSCFQPVDWDTYIQISRPSYWVGDRGAEDGRIFMLGHLSKP